jgi:ABC-type multidrug transport system permease subunit
MGHRVNRMTNRTNDTKSKLRETVYYTLVSFLVSIVSYIPIAILFAIISANFIASMKNYNINIDDFLLMWFYAIPAVALSTLFGSLGAAKKFFQNNKLELYSAV